jgi:electron transport complex protein RnfD
VTETPGKNDAASAETRDLVLASSPHLATTESVRRIMHTVWITLLPACLLAGYVFGYTAFLIIALSTAACIGFEMLFLALRGKKWPQVRAEALDGSAVITGVLLALNLPASSPWWLVLIGAFVAMSLGKHLFGGLGNNVFNPALVARVFLLISFPTEMLDYTPPVEDFAGRYDAARADAVTYATPLGKLKEAARAGGDAEEVARIREEIRADYPLLDLFLGFRPSGRASGRGRMGGCLGEISGLLLLLGAAFLFWRRIITWHIPVTFVAATALVTGIAWAADPAQYVNPLYHVCSGGLLLGALYMATDMVTSPVTPRGMLIFGAGCGLITAVIRLWGSYPEGVSFAILIMNGLVPLIDRATRPRKFGESRRIWRSAT